jgi:hypothetical protein
MRVCSCLRLVGLLEQGVNDTGQNANGDEDSGNNVSVTHSRTGLSLLPTGQDVDEELLSKTTACTAPEEEEWRKGLKFRKS